MNESDINLALAKWEGWRIKRHTFAHIISPTGQKGICCGLHLTDDEVWRVNLADHPEITLRIPSYTTDLNAIQTLVESLRTRNDSSWFDFPVELLKICGSYPNAINATARQRCEALLRTLNLWKP